MESRTRRRVLLDTTPQRLGRWLALSVALHAPLTPVVGLLGLFRFLDTEEQIPLLPPVTEIPLDILEDEAGGAEKPAELPEAPEPATVVEPAQPKEPEAPKPKESKPKEPEDAGAPDASTESDAGAGQDGGTAGDAGPQRKPGEGIGDPVAGIGDKRVVDPNANVKVIVFNDRVRQHPLGGRIGPLLRNVYQWRDFFEPTAIDPIRDVDRMLIYGPQLRDSREVVALLQFNIPQEKVRAAVDALVARDPEGGWLDAGVPVARAHADRGERVFVFPSPQVLVVAHPRVQPAAERLSRKFRLPGPQGDEIARAYLATPWRAFLGLPVAIPKSIKSAELRLSPMPDGGITIDLLAHDESEQLAKQDAEALTQALAAATTLDLGILGAFLGTGPKKFIQKGSFEADIADIRGEIVLTRAQVETLIDLAGGLLAGRASQARPRASATAPGSPAPATSGQR